MKKGLLIIGITVLIIGIGCLCYAALMWFAYKNTLDASSDFYAKRHLTAITFLIAGIAASILGTICLYMRNR